MTDHATLTRFAAAAADVDAAHDKLRSLAVATFLEAWDALNLTAQYFHVHTPDDGGDRSFLVYENVDIVNGELVETSVLSRGQRLDLAGVQIHGLTPWRILEDAVNALPIEALWKAAEIPQTEDLNVGGWNHTCSIDRLRAYHRA